uniref:Ig-like domain-containing protein n=1 Tax=Sinocyclocheilus rhinocerous TaxID=307959 RepID=A0A673MUX1_9TELE
NLNQIEMMDGGISQNASPVTNKLFSFSGFTVTYSQNRLVRLGSSVVLNCYRVKPLQTEDLKVEWRRKDTKTLVHLYQDGESQSEKQQQDYQDRAHFFTDQIQHGNFSLRLDNLKIEDAGEYTCRVYSEQKCVRCNSSHEYNCEML